VRLAFVALAVVVATGSAAAQRPAVPALKHMVVIVFENKDRTAVIGSSDAPTFSSLARRYAQLTQYYGVTHPSLPNYLALVSGSTHGITDDCTTCVVDGPSLADTLPAAGKTWKLYAEGLPRPGYTGAFSGRYAKKHVPFLYFRGVNTRRVVPLPQLRRDLSRNRLPNFAMIVPDLCNSMHDCSVAVGDAWLRAQVPPLLKLRKTAVFVVFDEGTSDQPIPALVLGTAVRPRSRFTRAITHYSLLRTIEAAWGLQRLGNSASAPPITGIWK
jgi:acid phosphatase